jgi:hypothetical protein
MVHAHGKIGGLDEEINEDENIKCEYVGCLTMIKAEFPFPT